MGDTFKDLKTSGDTKTFDQSYKNIDLFEKKCCFYGKEMETPKPVWIDDEKHVF